MLKYFFDLMRYLKYSVVQSKQYFFVYLEYHHNQINFFVVDRLFLRHVVELNQGFWLKNLILMVHHLTFEFA